MNVATKTDVLEAVLDEREYQDRGDGNAKTDGLESNTVAGSLLLMKAYIDKAINAYAGVHPAGRVEALDTVRKVTALGFRAMEVNGVVHRSTPASN